MTPTLLSLFSGGGGADVGARSVGMELAGAVEFDPDICAVYASNLGAHITCAPVETIVGTESESVYSGKVYTEYRQQDYDLDLDRHLTGCCDNRWYRATFRGKEYAVGIAYHA